MTFPKCAAEVTIDGSMLKDGDLAGLAAFQGDYALAGIRRDNNRLYAVMSSYTYPGNSAWELGSGSGKIEECVAIDDEKLRVRINADFGCENGDPDIAECRIYINGEYRKIGTGHHLRFIEANRGSRYADRKKPFNCKDPYNHTDDTYGNLDDLPCCRHGIGRTYKQGHSLHCLYDHSDAGTVSCAAGIHYLIDNCDHS